MGLWADAAYAHGAVGQCCVETLLIRHFTDSPLIEDIGLYTSQSDGLLKICCAHMQSLRDLISSVATVLVCKSVQL